MKIENYDEAMEYVERHRDEILGFIASLSSDNTPEALFGRLAHIAHVTAELWNIWLCHKDKYEKSREIADTLHQFFFRAANESKPA